MICKDPFQTKSFCFSVIQSLQASVSTQQKSSCMLTTKVSKQLIIDGLVPSVSIKCAYHGFQKELLVSGKQFSKIKSIIICKENCLTFAVEL